jgi:hypothetical protein
MRRDPLYSALLESAHDSANARCAPLATGSWTDVAGRFEEKKLGQLVAIVRGVRGAEGEGRRPRALHPRGYALLAAPATDICKGLPPRDTFAVSLFQAVAADARGRVLLAGVLGQHAGDGRPESDLVTLTQTHVFVAPLEP